MVGQATLLLFGGSEGVLCFARPTNEVDVLCCLCVLCVVNEFRLLLCVILSKAATGKITAYMVIEYKTPHNMLHLIPHVI